MGSLLNLYKKVIFTFHSGSGIVHHPKVYWQTSDWKFHTLDKAQRFEVFSIFKFSTPYRTDSWPSQQSIGVSPTNEASKVLDYRCCHGHHPGAAECLCILWCCRGGRCRVLEGSQSFWQLGPPYPKQNLVVDSSFPGTQRYSDCDDDFWIFLQRKHD